MPQKFLTRTRTWGTRFDTLPSSPPPSPLATGPPADAQDRDRELTKKKGDKMPHDASVFVGSLPSNIEQPELTRMLAEHLSEHTEIKNIKVVRDSKGGVCAFVQCEDSASAAILINTLHSAPTKPFMGRTLRYEPARAFRTLLISYRAPTQFVPARNSVNGRSSTRDSEAIKLDLPFAMRIWRPRNTKFYSILYNTEAVNAEAHSAAQNADGSMADGVLFLKPVLFNAETVRRLAAHFGKLENFSVYPSPGGLTPDSSSWQAFAGAHDAPRSANMDGRCWEIKWEHRDDCMSALTTLRRVPHLTVTWAHQPSTSPEAALPSVSSSRYANHIPNAPYVQESEISEQAAHDPTDNAFAPIIQFRDLLVKQSKISETGPGRISALGDAPDNSVASSVDDCEGDGWRTVRPQRVHSRTSGAQVVIATSVADSLMGEQKLDWSEMDFPPLGDVKGRKANQKDRPDGKCSTKSEKDEFERLPSPPILTTPGLTAESTITLVEHSTGNREHDTSFQDEAQELDMPPTPSLGMSPLTPKTGGSVCPVTPTSPGDDRAKLSFTMDMAPKDRELDTMTLFIGGLEMFGPGAWDEAKVTSFFARFGGLESVKLIRPMNSRAAFAFVKFNNTESPARAVFEEHNRVYEGRAMRVQFRDCNPSRASWKLTRGRGRYQNQLGLQRYPEPADKSLDEATHEPPEGDGTSSAITGINSEAIPSKPASPTHHGIEPADPGSSEDVPDEPLPLETTSPEIVHPTLEVPAQTEHYREWYDDPNLSVRTPPLSSLSSSTSNTAPPSTGVPPCPAPVGGYYPPPNWVSAYPQQMPYQIPYFGMYPGYPMAGQQTYPSPAGSEASGPTTAAPQATWPNMYGSYIPYPTTYPRAGADQLQQNGQAPVIPQGFIQNEQGTLIAVYQPEAINQYMAEASQNTPSHTAQHVQPQISNMSSWPQYLPSYPVPHMPPHARLYPPPTNHNVGWMPGQPPMNYPLQLPQHPGHPHANTGIGGTPFRGGYDAAGQNNHSQYRRQPGRRDQQGFNGGQSGRNNNQNGHNGGRSYGNRHGRGGVHSGPPGFHSNPPLQPQKPPHIATSSSSGDWSQWSAR